MFRRTKILIAVILIVILILVVLALFYWLFLRPKYVPPEIVPFPEAANINEEAPPSPMALPPINAAQVVPEVSDEEKLRSDLSRLAAAFAERFGSYSNQGDFENILDLKPLMTERMQSWADDFVERNRETRDDTSVYFGVTTKAISTGIIELNEAGGMAKIVVNTQKREASGTMTENVRIYYEDLELVFLKVGEEWKVDEAVWK